MKKTLIFILLAALCACAFCGCDMSIENANTPASPDSAGVIELTGSGAKSEAGGVKIDRSTVTVSAAGTYSVSGKLSDGQIIIDTGEDAGKVNLVLDGADITCLSGPAIWVKQAKKLDLVIADGSVNTLTSGRSSDMASFDSNASGGAIFAEDDLDIECDGKGILNIFGYINSGVVCKDDVDIKCGECELNITAANNGVKGSESVTVTGGILTVNAGHDGIKATNADKAGKGFVSITGGVIDVAAKGDGIAAETELNISGGVISVVTSGDPDSASCKALKAKTGISVTGGVVTLDSTDHAVHSAAGLTVSGGAFEIKSAGKGFAAHGDMSFSGGTFVLNTADDGMETKGDISFSGGAFEIVSGADGVKSGEKNSGAGSVNISGGTVLISACGDAFDAQGELTINGGTVLGLGNSKRVKGFSDGSTQGFVQCETSGGPGSTVTAGDSSLEAKYAYNLVLYSAPGLVSGSELEISAGTKTVTAAVK